jgi:hypothetical protein
MGTAAGNAAQTAFAPLAARGIAGLVPEDLTRGNLTLELGLSLWMHRTGTDLAEVTSALLAVRDALLGAAGLDRTSEPVPLLAGDAKTAALALAIYLDGLIDRAARRAETTRDAVVDAALALI